jgi:hypothetical protein
MSENHSSSDSSAHAPSTSRLTTGQQMAVFLVMLGASAGFTLYTRKTDSMLKQMSKIKKFRPLPVKYGPITKQEWEKIKPRWGKGDGIF